MLFVATFPALSVAVADIVRIPTFPLFGTVVSTQLSIPDRLSAALQVAVGIESPQVNSAPLEMPAIDTDGAVLSILMFATVTLAALSALSSAAPVTDWSAPSELRVTGKVHDLIPANPSAHV